MWDLIVSVPDHCLSFYFGSCASFIYLFIYFQSLGSDFQISLKLIR